ncbi:glucokinase [Mesonia hippocampi]|uniref:Glucokinase n=1 Tax=Mesonia hippocampi TaxID=1628250 RepID=A0A840EU84_9FLAO|nr:hypothetical protein [Mesonia hippocampi]MBB4119026.1 glucokinase [Mesonia hippocampi]
MNKKAEQNKKDQGKLTAEKWARFTPAMKARFKLETARLMKKNPEFEKKAMAIFKKAEERHKAEQAEKTQQQKSQNPKKENNA